MPGIVAARRMQASCWFRCMNLYLELIYLAAGGSFHPVEILLENLPVFQAGHFALVRFVDRGFLRVFGRLVDLVENAEAAGERFAGELVGRELVGDVVRLGDF